MSEVLSGGYINTVLMTPDRSVLKRYDGEQMIHIPREQRYLREATALHHFGRQESVKVPAVYHHDPVESVIEMEFLPGWPLDSYLREVGEAERRSILEQSGSMLRRIHQPVNSSYDLVDAYETRAERAFARAAPILEREGIDAEETFHIARSAVDRQALADAGITRVHRDYWLNNVIYDGNQITGVIDWELAGIGSPYEDFAIINLWIEREHPDIDAFWAGYGGCPDRRTMLAYVMSKCAHFAGNATEDDYLREKDAGSGFYLNKFDVIRDIKRELCE